MRYALLSNMRGQHVAQQRSKGEVFGALLRTAIEPLGLNPMTIATSC